MGGKKISVNRLKHLTIFYAIVLVISVQLPVLSYSQQQGSIKSAGIFDEEYSLSLNILGASYGNLDDDEYEDDIWVMGEFCVTDPEELPIFLILVLQLVSPEGQVITHYQPLALDMISAQFYIYGYDTVTSSGYYQAILSGHGFGIKTPLYNMDFILFDPPGKTNADPSSFDFFFV